MPFHRHVGHQLEDEWCVNGEQQRLWTDVDVDLPTGVTGVEKFHKWVNEHKDMSLLKILQRYNIRDVCMMVPIIDQMNRDFNNMDPMLELFRGNVSLPNISRLLGYKSCKDTLFFLPKGKKEGEHIDKLFRDNLAGGPSMIYNRIIEDRKVG